MAEKNAKRREQRAKLKVVPKDEAFGEPTEIVTEKLKGNGKLEDIGIPAFLDRTNPENEKKAVAASAKQAEAVRSRPVLSLPQPKPSAAVIEKPSAAVIEKPKPLSVVKTKTKSASGKSCFQVTAELVVQEPNIKIEALLKAVQAKIPGASKVTVVTTRAGIRNTMLLIQKLRGIEIGCI
jgi:hypothetical protein